MPLCSRSPGCLEGVGVGGSHPAGEKDRQAGAWLAWGEEAGVMSPEGAQSMGLLRAVMRTLVLS